MKDHLQGIVTLCLCCFINVGQNSGFSEHSANLLHPRTVTVTFKKKVYFKTGIVNVSSRLNNVVCLVIKSTQK